MALAGAVSSGCMAVCPNGGGAHCTGQPAALPAHVSSTCLRLGDVGRGAGQWARPRHFNDITEQLHFSALGTLLTSVTAGLHRPQPVGSPPPSTSNPRRPTMASVTGSGMSEAKLSSTGTVVSVFDLHSLVKQVARQPIKVAQGTSLPLSPRRPRLESSVLRPVPCLRALPAAYHML